MSTYPHPDDATIDTEAGKLYPFEPTDMNAFHTGWLSRCRSIIKGSYCVAIGSVAAFAYTLNPEYLTIAVVIGLVAVIYEVILLMFNWSVHLIVERLRALEQAQLETKAHIAYWGQQALSGRNQAGLHAVATTAADK